MLNTTTVTTTGLAPTMTKQQSLGYLLNLLGVSAGYKGSGCWSRVACRHGDYTGAQVAVVPHADGRAPSVAFACHLDTVDQDNGTRKVLGVSESGLITLARKEAGQCLGADDGAGLFVLQMMRRAGVPGVYLFFDGEESGGQGVRAFCSSTRGKELMQTVTHVVEFDRRGTEDVVYLGGWGRAWGGSGCDGHGTIEFAQRVAEALQAAPEVRRAMDWERMEPSDEGVFSDINVLGDTFAHLDCVNVSVGYYDAHSPDETLDWEWLWHLVNRAISTDWHQLVVGLRKREAPKPRGWMLDVGTKYTKSSNSIPWLYDDNEYVGTKYECAGKSREYRDMEDAVLDDIDGVVHLMLRLGYSADELRRELYDMKGGF